MSYLDRQYISTSGHDYTPYINNAEDFEKFEEMIEHENKCIGVPAEQCIEDIVAFLNIGRELMGIEHKVIYIGKQNPQMN